MIFRPYRRSWVDALIARIEHLPGPPWVFYLVATVFFSVFTVVVRWLDGSLPVGSFDLVLLVWSLLTVYGLGAIHYLNRVAETALESYRPALGELEPQYSELKRGLTSMPQAPAIFAVVVGIGIQTVGSLSSSNGWGAAADANPLTRAFAVVDSSILNVFFAVFLFRTIRQLRKIVRIHRASSAINLYAPEPHNAFSRLTLATSISISVPLAVAEVIGASAGEISPFDIGLLIGLLSVAAAVFVLPLRGMHRQLVRQKSRLTTDTDLKFQATVALLHAQIDTGNFDGSDSVNKTLSSLGIESDRLKKISTWPWRPETLRGFFSTIALPILLWLITTLLSRLL